MVALLGYGAARRLVGLGGWALPQRTREAERHRRRLIHTTKERIAEGTKSLKDLSDQVGSRRDGFDWRTFPYAGAAKCVGSIGMGVIKATVLLAILSECRVSWLFGKDRPEEAKSRA